jgi:hypothetical protein
MSNEKNINNQNDSVELSEQDLDAVAGGVAAVNIDIGAIAQGSQLAFTDTNATTVAFSNGIASVGAGAGFGVAVGVNNPTVS